MSVWSNCWGTMTEARATLKYHPELISAEIERDRLSESGPAGMNSLEAVAFLIICYGTLISHGSECTYYSMSQRVDLITRRLSQHHIIPGGVT